MGLTSELRGTTAVPKEGTEAISPVFGLVHHIIQMGGMNEESSNNFLMNIRQHLDAHEIHNLIFYGVPAHR